MLADRVGIIDHGHIVAEGTPAALKAEVGRPTLEAIPADPADEGAPGDPRPLRRARARAAGVAVRLRTATALAEVVRALDARAFGRAAPGAPAVARRRVPRQDRPLARGRGRRRGEPAARRWGRVMSATADQVVLLARRSVVRTLRQPANVIASAVFPLMLLAVNSGGLKAETHLPGFPTTIVRRLRAGGAVHPGRAVRDDELRHRPGPRHPDRLPEPALDDADARRRAARGPARRRRHPGRRSRRPSTCWSGWRSGSGSRRRPGVLVCSCSRR